MPKTNQIPYLSPSRRTPGAVYHWKPSPKLRREGWTNLKLGEDWDAACVRAMSQNRDVEQWLRLNGRTEPSRRAPPRILRWRDLVDAYHADPAYLDLKPKSRGEYDSRLRTLTVWAIDGTLRLEDLDRTLIVAFRNTLVRDPRKHRTAALLRVLRVIVNFGIAQGWLPRGLVDDLDIPEVAARRTIVAPNDVERLAARAAADGDPAMALAIRLGFWTFQREGDLLSLTRMSWREVKDLSPFARRTLAGGVGPNAGKVMGVRLQQHKTAAWVHVPLPPPLKIDVEAVFRAVERLDAPLLSNGDGPIADWAFQRAFRRLAQAEDMGHVQFRDLRRSGMVYAGELGVELQFITARSGHAVLGNKRTILDTYMPGNSRFAAEGMAIQWQRHLERIEQEAQSGEKDG